MGFQLRINWYVKRFLILLLVITPSLNAKEKTLKVGFHHWPPNQFLDSSNKAKGIDITLTRAIFAQAEIPIEFQFYPWKRTVFLLESGEIDVAMSAGYTEARSKFVWFTSEVYRTGYNSLFIRATDKQRFQPYSTLAAMRGSEIKIGATIGTSYSNEYEKLLKGNGFKRQLNLVERDTTNFELLVKGRIDAVLASETIGLRIISHMGVSDDIVLHMHLYSPEQAETFLMLSKKSVDAAIVARVDKAIKALKDSGEYDSILDQ